MEDGAVITIDPKGEFFKAIKKAQKEVGDLRTPFKEITASWYRGNKSIFTLKGPGKYKPLSEKYKKQKIKDVGFAYPALERSGHLKRSLTVPGHENSIVNIINKSILVLGTNVTTKDGKPYAIFNHKGSKKIGLPARPVVLLGVEQVSNPIINKRVELWTRVIQEYVQEKSRGFSK